VLNPGTEYQEHKQRRGYNWAYKTRQIVNIMSLLVSERRPVAFIFSQETSIPHSNASIIQLIFVNNIIYPKFKKFPITK
jgi:hypothetical protein